MIDRVTETAPGRIWLQVSDDAGGCGEKFPGVLQQDPVTWCDKPCVACEVEYVRADLGEACPLTKAEMHQLRYYALRREGGYYGNKAVSDKRHAAILAWLDAACTA